MSDVHLEKAAKMIGVKPIFEFEGHEIHVVCVIAWSPPLIAEWWRGKEASIITADVNGNFFLRHCDGSVRYWEHSKRSDVVVARSVKEFANGLRECNSLCGGVVRSNDKAEPQRASDTKLEPQPLPAVGSSVLFGDKWYTQVNRAESGVTLGLIKDGKSLSIKLPTNSMILLISELIRCLPDGVELDHEAIVSDPINRLIRNLRLGNLTSEDVTNSIAELSLGKRSLTKDADNSLSLVINEEHLGVNNVHRGDLLPNDQAEPQRASDTKMEPQPLPAVGSSALLGHPRLTLGGFPPITGVMREAFERYEKQFGCKASFDPRWYESAEAVAERDQIYPGRFSLSQA